MTNLQKQIMAILKHDESIADMTEGVVNDYFCEDCGDTFWGVSGGESRCPYCGGKDTHEG